MDIEFNIFGQGNSCFFDQHSLLDQSLFTPPERLGGLSSSLGGSEKFDIPIFTPSNLSSTFIVNANFSGLHPLVDPFVETSEIVNGEAVNISLFQVSDSLKHFIQQPNYLDHLQVAFGSEWEPEIATTLLNDLAEGENLPTIEIVKAEKLQAQGGFSQQTNTIYLAEEFIAQNPTDVIARVITEELGHYIDASLNVVDSPGDEGQLFVALVNDIELTPAQLQAIKAEDDHRIVTINGQTLLIEQSVNEIIGTSGRDVLIGTQFSDRITGGFAADTIFGGLGSDTFVYNNIRDAGDIIKDFELRTDVIDLTGVLNSFGYNGVNPISDGYLKFSSYSGGTTILLDSDGNGSLTARPYLQVENVTPNQLSSFTGHFLPRQTIQPPSIKLTAESDSGVSNIDSITRDRTPTITGNTKSGAVVKLYNGSTLLGETTANTTGIWQITTGELNDGTQNFTAIATDVAGNVSSPSLPLNVVIDTVSPVINLTNLINTVPLQNEARLTGKVDGTGSGIASLNYRFGNLPEKPLVFNAAGEFDQALDFSGVSNEDIEALLRSPNPSLTITTTDIAGNTTTRQFNVIVPNGVGNNAPEIISQPETDYIILRNTNKQIQGIALGTTQAGLAEIQGQAFLDFDRNGVRSREAGLDGFVVELVNSATGEVVGTQITRSFDVNGDGKIDPFAEQGLYKFTNLQGGSYQVRQVSSDAWSLTLPASSTYNLTLNGRERREGINFGNGQNYVYEVRGIDADSDTLTYSLVSAPQGATIDSQTGKLIWTPPATGEYAFKIKVADGKGGEDIQEYKLNVLDPNRLPSISSNPGGNATVGQNYTYQIVADNPDLDGLNFQLNQAPQGMTISPDGLIQWTPQGNQIGAQQVKLLVKDDRGGEVEQVFTIVTQGSPANPQPSGNYAPVITSNFVGDAIVSQQYIYDVDAVDADGDTLSYSLVNAPQNMVIDPTSGVITWNTSSQTLGTYNVTVQVKDNREGIDNQTFSVNLTNSEPGTIQGFKFNDLNANGIWDIGFTPTTGSPANATLTGNSVLLENNTTRLEVKGGLANNGLVPVDGYFRYTDTASNEEVTWSTDPVLRFSDGITTVLSNSSRGGFGSPNLIGDGVVRSTTTTNGIVVQADTTLIGTNARTTFTFSGNQLDGTTFIFYAENDIFSFSDDTAAFTGSIAGNDLALFMYDTAAGGLSVRMTTETGPGSKLISFGSGTWTGFGQALEQGNLSVLSANGSNFVKTGDIGNAFAFELTGSSASLVINYDTDPQPPEPGLEGWVIYTDDNNNGKRDGDERFATTDANGSYTLTGLAPGTYRIREEQKPGWKQTVPQDKIYELTVAPGDSVTNINFGNYQTPDPATNSNPFFTSTAPTNVISNGLFRYNAFARDRDGDVLSFDLLEKPDGMAVDASKGVVVWRPTADQIGIQNVVLRVQDGRGGSATQTFQINVGDGVDRELPTVQFGFSSNIVNIGESVTFNVSGTDNNGIANIALTIDGNPVTLNAGSATVQLNKAGVFQVVATATDTAGNVVKKDLSLRVLDPSDTTAPTVEIISPQTNKTITNLTDIVGSINDNNLEFYRVDYAPLDLVDINNLAAVDPDFVTISEGKTNVNKTIIGQFDPTVLFNGNYVLRVTAQDFSGNISSRGVFLGVSGDNKVGNFRLELTDLSIPLAGIPIQINRVYDTLQSSFSNDFGFGWSLGVKDAKIQESVPLTDAEKQGVPSLFAANPFTAGTKVYLTNPEGRRVGFTFDPYIAGGSLLGAFWKPRFVADAGVYDKLEVDDINLQQRSDGSFSLFFIPFAYNPSEYKLTTKDGTTYEYDQFKGLQEVKDRNNNTLTFRDNGIFSSTGASVEFLRDTQGRITQIKDPTGKAILYGYDARGNLVSVTDQAGLVSRHTYLANPNYLEQIIDPRGKAVIRTEYDAKGRVKATKDALGNNISNNYNVATGGSSTTQIDPLGRITTTVRDNSGNIVSTISPIGAIRRYTYDVNNNQISETDPRGFTINRAYDAQGNITSITEPLGVNNSFSYDKFNNIKTATDSLGRTLSYAYDNEGNLLQITDPAGGRGQFTSDKLGRVTSFSDPNGNTTNFIFSSNLSPSQVSNKPTQVIFPDGSTRKFEYNEFGQISRTIDENGYTTTFVTDSIGRLLKQRDHLGNEITYQYEAQNLISATDPLGNVTKFEYDDASQLIRRIDPQGGITQFSYDALGRLIIETDQLGRTTTISYCACGSVSSITDPSGNVTSFEYDLSGNRTAVIDPLGQRTSFIYDALGRLIKRIDPLGNIETFVYDTVDNLIETTDRNGRVRRFNYDQLNQLVQETWWNNNSLLNQINFTYDPAGNILSAQNQTNRYAFSYDKRDRVTTVNAAVIPDSEPIVLEYKYNQAGKIISVADNLGTITQSTYNSLNQVSSQTLQITDGSTARFDISYNATGDRTQLRRFSDIAGTQLVSSTTFEYEPIADNTALKARTYNSRGDSAQLEQFLNIGSNLLSNKGYTAKDVLQPGNNTRKRITDIEHTNANGVEIASHNNKYDSVGQIISESYKGQINEFSYDTNGQLITANRSTLPDENYIYDANGNPISQGYVIGTNNQILSDGSFNYTYDAEGNVLTKTRITNNEVIEYTYNHRNQLVAVTSKDVSDRVRQKVEFIYDVFDRRIAKIVDGNPTYFIHDRDNIWAEFDATAEVIARYFNESDIDGLIARYRPNDGISWYLKDRLGTVRDIIDNTGQPINQLDYSSFGQIITESNPVASDRFGFTGREYDEETGLYYYRARYYDPSLGRFISQDPIGFEAGDTNLYRYVNNSPLNGIDPTGLVSLSEYNKLVSTVVTAVRKCLTSISAGNVQNILESGVYLFLLEDGRWYVGQTNDFDRRLNEHKAKKFISETIQKIPFPAEDRFKLGQVEQYLYDVVDSVIGGEKRNLRRPQSPKKPKLPC
ncbi:putative Ig domain-containing protein [Calothrix membranacea FACHB-236]|nr:putative Ig domain-containing protein [Calothrix membranacea FACHB-236]